MATIESTVRMLNRRLREVYEFFGYKSPEYQDLQSIVYKNFQNEFIVRGGGKKAARLSRSKAAMQAYNDNEYLQQDLEWINETVRRMGSVKDMAERYVEPNEYSGLFTNSKAKALKSTIQERANAEYASKYNDHDIYTEIQNKDDEGDSDFREALADIMEKFHEKPGENNLPGMEQKYSEIVDMYERAVEMHEEKKAAVGHAANILKVKNPFDMGMNP